MALVRKGKPLTAGQELGTSAEVKQVENSVERAPSTHLKVTPAKLPSCRRLDGLRITQTERLVDRELHEVRAREVERFNHLRQVAVRAVRVQLDLIGEPS